MPVISNNLTETIKTHKEDELYNKKAQSLFKQAKILANTGKNKEAIIRLEKLIENYPKASIITDAHDLLSRLKSL